MPTGYTAALYDGDQSFEQFVRNAARGMGAFYHLREASWDTPLTYPEPQAPRAKEDLKEAMRENTEWRLADEHERYRLWSEQMERQANYNSQAEIDEFLARRDRFDAMTAKVEAKKVPKELETFKKFMLQQLGTEFEYRREPYKPEVTPFYEWCDHQTEWRQRREDQARERYRDMVARDAEVRHYIDLLGETFGFKVDKD